MLSGRYHTRVSRERPLNRLLRRLYPGPLARARTVEALKLYRRAAEQGVVEAQYNIGLMHMAGEGTPKDDGEAARWFQRAAETGALPATVMSLCSDLAAWDP